MIFVELIVNRPIRRSFHKKTVPPSLELHTDPDNWIDPLSDTSSESDAPADARLQLFHYHLPIELESIAQPGHLVWVPFGAQEVQGFIVRRSEESPVPTRAVLRLARPEPVLTSAQLALAGWIAEYYVAPISEAVKLFLPPGLLSKEDGTSRARAKRELKIELAVAPEAALAGLSTLGRETQQVRVLSWLLTEATNAQIPAVAFPVSTICEACELKSTATLQTLAKHGVIHIEDTVPVATLHADTLHTLHTLHTSRQAETDDTVNENAVDGPYVRLAVPIRDATEALLALRGATQYRPILQALIDAGCPLWKSELYERVDATLQQLRALRKAGLVAMREEVRFRDPLAGRTYLQTSPPRFTNDQNRVWQQILDCAFPGVDHDRLRDGTVKVNTADNHVVEIEKVAANETSTSELAHGEGGSNQSPRQNDEIPLFTAQANKTQPVGNGQATKFLLHGVTGSGKTEIYLRAIQETLARGKQAIVLVPEIALTPQTVARFAGRFPGRVTVIHSGLSAGERYDVWRHLRDGAFDIVVGPRSALFAPLDRLGLIILDEEHESSYKQNAEAWGSFTVFYDARVVAAQLAELCGCPLIYGSATPSLERYMAAQQGDLILLEMLRRVVGHAAREDLLEPVSQYAELPPVEIVDMRQELRAGHRSILSRALLSEIHATLDAGEQAILFLNRRGTRTFVMCRDCGHVQQCARCDVPLTFHENTNILICHHCNQRVPIPQICDECESKRIKYFGSGTQRLEELIQQITPHARLMRWDADTASGKGSHEEILRRFSAHEADILIGTQMIAKGLDFPMVTLVGVVAADVGLYLPDFRSGERAFQLLTQVAGRAGRSERGGRVVIQSYRPDHYAIQAAAQHDYHAFYAREMMFRHEHGYPPLRSMARLIYWDKKLEKAEEASAAMADVLRYRLQQLGLEGDAAAVLGPAPAFFARYRGYYRWQVILRAPQPAQILRGIDIPFGWRIDIDPISML